MTSAFSPSHCCTIIWPPYDKSSTLLINRSFEFPSYNHTGMWWKENRCPRLIKWHNKTTQTVEIRIANTFSIEIYQMKPKKSSFFSINFPSFSCFFTFFVFAIFYRFMYKSDYQGTYGFNSFFYVVVCSQCTVVEKVSWDFCRKL